MSRITVCSEANLPACERFKGSKQRVVSSPPRFPDTLRSLPGVDVAGTIHTKATVFFVATVDAVAADQTIQARANRFGRGNGFNEYPNLNHVTRFPVVTRVIEARGDDDSGGVLVEEKSVQREPPRVSIKATRAIRRMKPKAQSGPWKRG
jgi:hypothetical protein